MEYNTMKLREKKNETKWLQIPAMMMEYFGIWYVDLNILDCSLEARDAINLSA